MHTCGRAPAERRTGLSRPADTTMCPASFSGWVYPHRRSRRALLRLLTRSLAGLAIGRLAGYTPVSDPARPAATGPGEEDAARSAG